MVREQDDRHEFKPLLVEIEERPLNPLGRAVFWIVISALFFACLWMFLGRVDVVVTARGKVIPNGEVKVIQPLNTGVVRSILVRAGDHVAEGQILLEIDPSDLDPELASMKADLHQVDLEIVRINALINNVTFSVDKASYDVQNLLVQQQIYDTEKLRIQQQVRAKQEVLEQLNQQLQVELQASDHSQYMVTQLTDRITRLATVKDIISHDDYEKTESDLKSYQTELLTSSFRRAEITSKQQQTRQEIAFLKEDQRNRLLTELAEKKQRQLYLAAQIEQTAFRSQRQQIKAPVDGYISRLLFHTVGGVVSPAEKLAFIVPDNTTLLIKASLLNKDTGFVAAEMPATIKIDTFNFQKYGTIGGRVLQVSKDSIEDEQFGLVYDLYIQPDKYSLNVEGVETPITAGMSVTAEVKVGKRRIIEFFIYPLIKYLDEGMSVR